ncbi:MAG: YggS family pyridoxal phosphate enzyme, partial [Acidimicrobiales bacterium]
LRRSVVPEVADMAAADAARIAANLADVRRRVSAAGGSGVTVVAVTKTQPLAVLRAAVEAGCDALGENYVQEIVAKLAGAPAPGPLHMIGTIQSNKVRKIASLVSLWQSVDRESVIEEIGRRVAGGGCGDVLLQVNLTGEDGKGGCAPGRVERLRAHAEEHGVRVLGLMTVGPTEGGPEGAEPVFTALRRMCDEGGLGVCSMGMPADYEVAVGCGSTMVRIGSALLGPRA